MCIITAFPLCKDQEKDCKNLKIELKITIIIIIIKIIIIINNNNVAVAFWMVPKSLKNTERMWNPRLNRSYLDHSTAEIGKNTQRSPGDLRRLAVTQIPVKDHHLKLMWKTWNEWMNYT